MLVILDSDQEHRQVVHGMIESLGYPARVFNSWEDYFSKGTGREVLLVDLDSIRTDDRRLREIVRGAEPRFILTMSASPHHPHLGESMQRYVFAALHKPLDSDELAFWLKSIERMGTTESACGAGSAENDPKNGRHYVGKQEK